MSVKLKKQILKHLQEQPLTLKEIAEKMGLKEKRAFKLIRSLYQKGQINSFKDENNQKRYKPVGES